MRLSSLLLIGLLALPASVASQHAEAPVPVTPDMLTWTELGLIPGVMVAVVHGNPMEGGEYTLRLKFPDGTRMPAHWHPKIEYATVLSGTALIAMGEIEDLAALEEYPAGSFLVAPARMAHYGRVRGETIIQLSGPGPYEVVFVNPADDPRKQ